MTRSCSSEGWLCRTLSSTGMTVLVFATVAAGSWASAAWPQESRVYPGLGAGLRGCGEDAEGGAEQVPTSVCVTKSRTEGLGARARVDIYHGVDMQSILWEFNLNSKVQSSSEILPV